jgi:hypothetical protein
MSRNGSGTYSLPIGNPVVTGTTISSTWANNTLTDIANALTGSLAADGQTTATGNLNMGTANRIINLADPASAQDAVTKYYVDQLVGALGTMAYQDADNVDISGGLIDLRNMTNEVFLPVGPTETRSSSPTAGLIRYNSDDGGFYEGYESGEWVRFVTVPEGNYTMRYLIAAGGGGSGAGGAGAGGTVDSSISVIPGTTFLISVGAGGAPRTQGTNSSISGTITAIGGGYGNIYGSGGNGGSGGAGFAFGTGDARGPQSGGTGTSGQGYGGGGSGTGGSQGGGGGGASAPGGNGDGTSEVAGNGGAGLLSNITGVGVYYGGGGGGGNVPYNTSVAGTGGAGGGGNGNGYSGNNGSANTGGGAGGGGGGSPEVPATPGANGGSGVVILNVPTANYSGTYSGSPDISTYGSSTVLKFNASGSYTA